MNSVYEGLRVERSDHPASASEHYHNSNEIMFVEQGEILVKVAGKVMTAAAPALVFINNLEVHSIDIVKTPYVSYFMVIPNATLYSMAHGSYLGSVFVNSGERFGGIVEVSGWEREVSEISARAYAEFCGGEAMSREMIVNDLSRLLIMLLRRRPELFLSVFGDEDNLILKAKRYVDENYAEDITVDDVAARFFISRSYLAHEFKKVTGLSPKQYIMSCRLARSRELLLNSDKSISEIAAASGFADVNNFIRYFKRNIGMSPRVYRKTRSVY